MPIYEYECDGCGYRFERQQSMASEPVNRCPHCGEAVRRVIYPVGIIFRGSGFYVTDHPRLGEHQGRRPDHSSDRDNGASKEESKGSEGSGTAEEASGE